MNERLYIKEIQQELQYRDRRSVRRWCRNNGVKIFCDIGSNRCFVLKEEFEMAKSKNYLIQQDCDNSIMNIISNSRKLITEKAMGYMPKGKYEMKFLNFLHNF